MYDHIGLKVKDLAASIAFYKAALAPLGHVLCSEDEGSAGLGPKGAPALWLYANKNAKTGAHVAFRAADHAAVEAFHRAGLKAGGRDNGKAGLRADYLQAQLGAWRSGVRRAVEPDCMARIAHALGDDELAAAAIWIASQPVPDKSVASPTLTTLPLECGGVR